MSEKQPKADPQESARILELYRQMWRIRKFEEAAAEAHRSGRAVGPVHQSIGQEAIPVGVCANLHESDFITSTHRGHGHVLAKGADMKGMMSELYGRADGICGGKGGSMHIADVTKGILGANGVVGAGINIAVGSAHAHVLLGRPSVTVCFFGDGAINRGPFLEGLNWASVYKLPVLFVCEDNQFASTTRTSTVTAGAGPMGRAASLGVEGLSIDGNDVVAVDSAARQLLDQVRHGAGPKILHARTFRMKSHLVGDERVYRTDEELDARWAEEPVARCTAFLREAGVSEEDLAKCEADAQRELEAAIDHALAAPWPAPEAAFLDVQDLGGAA